MTYTRIQTRNMNSIQLQSITVKGIKSILHNNSMLFYRRHSVSIVTLIIWWSSRFINNLINNLDDSIRLMHRIGL